MGYEIIKPFTLQDIMNENPCNSDGEFWDLCDEFRKRNYEYNHKIFSYEIFKTSKTLMRYRDWFINKGFVKKVLFKPFDITFRVNNKKDLETLWCRMNICIASVNEAKPSSKYKCYSDTLTRYWNIVDKEMDKVKD